MDYEHWYISLDKKYHIKPDFKAWYEEMSATLDVKDTYVFADFTKGDLREEKQKIRAVTNKIIETGSMTTYVQKDFTDFIMLDQIYQESMSRKNDIDVFVIFTGDGHFYSVVSFLKNICKKTVGIYAVHGAVSNQLKMTANWVKELPTDGEKLKPYFQKILTFLSEAENDASQMTPTFLYTVEQVKTRWDIDADETREALQYLVDNGYVRRGTEHRSGRTVTVVSADWRTVLRDDLWLPERGMHIPQMRTATKHEKQSVQPQKTVVKEPEPAPVVKTQEPAAEKSAQTQKKKPRRKAAPKQTPSAEPIATTGELKKQTQKKSQPHDRAQNDDLTPVKLPRRLQNAVPVTAEPGEEIKPKPKRRHKSSKPKTDTADAKTVEKTAEATAQPTAQKKRRRRKPAHKPTENKETT